jgi:hypothetical protein
MLWQWTAHFDSAVVLPLNVWAIASCPRLRTAEDFSHNSGRSKLRTRSSLVRRTVSRLHGQFFFAVSTGRWRVTGRKCDIIDIMLDIGKHTSNPHLTRPRDLEHDFSAPSHVQGVSLILLKPTLLVTRRGPRNRCKSWSVQFEKPAICSSFRYHFMPTSEELGSPQALRFTDNFFQIW